MRTSGKKFHVRLRAWAFSYACLHTRCLAIPVNRTRISEGLRPISFIPTMKKFFILILLSIIAFNAIHAEITWNLSNDGTLTISGTGEIKTYPWISERDKIKKIVIKNGVTNIGDNVFSWCSSLTSVSIPNSVISIGKSAFTLCKSLTSINIPNSVKSIGEKTFAGCSSLTSISIPYSVTSISYDAFQNCPSIESIIVEKNNPKYDSRDNCNAIIETGTNSLIIGCKVTVIPNSVTSIGYGAFNNCSSLVSISIPNSVKSIGISAFSGCSSLTSIDIPNSVTSLEEFVFSSCTSLTTVSIPNTVASIKNAAFLNCSSLVSISIPKSVTSIESNPFSRCSGLESIIVEKGNPKYDSRNKCNAIIETATNSIITGCKNTIIPNTVTSIGEDAFEGCTFTTISIPNSVETIDFFAFANCPSLVFVHIPNSVTKIGQASFASCSSMTSIILPNSLTNIDHQAFMYCKSISKLTCSALTPPSIGSDVFKGVQCDTGTLYVPASSLSAYKAADGWKDWQNIKAIIEATNISFQNASESVFLGKTKTLKATVMPETTTDKTIFWTSSNTDVATVSSEGIVTAKKVGTTIVTAETYNGKTAKCTITVKQPVTAIALSDATTSLWVDDTKTLTATVTPTDASNTAVNWSSSNTKVATVSSNGVITAKGKGSCTITCTAADGYGTKSTCKVIVKQPVTSIALSDATSSLWVGETKTIVAKVTPTNANNTSVEWSSSDNNVATVSSKGVVTAKGKGTCTITCKAVDGYGTKSTCSVTVKQPVTSIALSDATSSLWVGETKTITATVTPTSANNTAVKWSSSDTKVATVNSDGTITAIGKGTCTITCTAADGYGTKSTCKVTVKQQVNSIDLGYETLNMLCGTEKTLTPTINPSNADIKTLTWKSTDNTVATITSGGVLTAVSPGTATITCTATDDFKKSSSITVIVEPLDITITDKNPTIKEGTYREGSISYTRTLTKNKYTTFCMPYDVNLSEYTDYFSKVYVPMETAFVKSGGKLTIMFKSISLTETIRAGHPFIALASKSGTVAIKNGSKVTITSLEEPMPTNLEVYNYGGNLLAHNTDIDVKITGNYFFVTDLDDANNFTFSVNGQMVGATTVSPYRFYITKNDDRSNAKITDIQLSFDGEEATGIEVLQITNDNNSIYNLKGQRINKANVQKGVYIKNGKKAVVK